MSDFEFKDEDCTLKAHEFSQAVGNYIELEVYFDDMSMSVVISEKAARALGKWLVTWTAIE